MTRKVHCEKKTKIYIPKTVNPQIISYRASTENNSITSPQSNSRNDIPNTNQQ